MERSSDHMIQALHKQPSHDVKSNNRHPMDRGTYHRAHGLFGCLVLARRATQELPACVSRRTRAHTQHPLKARRVTHAVIGLFGFGYRTINHRTPTAPKGQNEIAQGKAKRRPGYGSVWVDAPRGSALSGLGRIRAHRTQGVSLGYHLAPRWGKRPLDRGR